jgi:hypothetical protein
LFKIKLSKNADIKLYPFETPKEKPEYTRILNKIKSIANPADPARQNLIPVLIPVSAPPSRQSCLNYA